MESPKIVEERAPSVLLVEDDNFFRSVISKNLTRRGLIVREAENGLVAKTIFEMAPENFDLVISDVQMPALDGVSLLKFIRTLSDVPYIVMTGFSVLLEAKDAHALGATEFLPKPVRTDAMLEAVARCLGPNRGTALIDVIQPVSSKPQEAKFCQIHVDEFVSATHLVSDVYLKLGERYIKAAHEGEAVPVDRIKKYQSNQVDYLFVRQEDFKKYLDFSLKISGLVAKNSVIPNESKLKLFRHTAEIVAENCFKNSIERGVFDSASRIVQDTVDLLSNDEDLMDVMLGLDSHAERVYRHSVFVALLGVLTARAYGWRGTSTLLKVTLCGLFHDIGKKEISKEILNKRRIHLTDFDIRMIESHVVRGREILTVLSGLPEDVATVAYQHHENFNGTGYPQALKSDHIHPIARLIRVVDLFVNYMDSAIESERVSAEVALQKILDHHTGEFDPNFLNSLAKAVRVPLVLNSLAETQVS